MKGDNNKYLSILVVAIIISAAIAVGVTYGLKTLEDKEPLSVKIFADSSEGTAPFAVNFSSIVANNKGDVEYQWDFGNGQTSDEREPSITYEKDGEYICSLKISDDEQTESDYIKILSKKNKPPVVTLSINQNAIDRKFTWISLISFIPAKFFMYPGNHQEWLENIKEKQGPDAWGEGRIVVTAQVSDPEDDEIVSYEWREQTSDSLLKANGDAVHPTHEIEGNESVRVPELYAWTPFQHVVMLTVTDSAGNKANATTYFTVSENVKKTKAKQSINLIFKVLIMQVYNQLVPNEYKHLLSDPLWNLIFEPLTKFIPVVGALAAAFLGNIFPPPVPKADLNISFDSEAFNHSKTINQNGGVSEKVSITKSITIKNIDDENTAKDVYIKLKDPVTLDNGLVDKLENDKVVVKLQSSDTNKTLYFDKVYTDGIAIGDLTPGSEFTGKLIFTILEADNDTFEDNKNYECGIYVHQTGSDYFKWSDKLLSLPIIERPSADKKEFTVKT